MEGDKTAGRSGEVIWAPWRKGYVVQGDKEDQGCVFCRALAAGDDRGHYLLRRDAGCFLIMNRFPYNNGHLLVLPERHVADLCALTEGESRALLALTRRALTALRACLRPAGFNVGLNLGAAAGAGIASHLHLHVVPRWAGDTNFMPVTGGVKAIPDSLDALYEELDRHL